CTTAWSTSRRSRSSHAAGTPRSSRNSLRNTIPTGRSTTSASRSTSSGTTAARCSCRSRRPRPAAPRPDPPRLCPAPLAQSLVLLRSSWQPAWRSKISWHEEPPRDDHGWWEGLAARAADGAPLQAGRAVRWALPDHRLRALELRELRLPQDLRDHAVHVVEPDQAPVAQLAAVGGRRVHRGRAGADAD